MHSSTTNYCATMALIPSLENVLLEVHQSLGLKRDPRKKKYAEQKMQLDNHLKMTSGIIESIFDALDMDEQAADDARNNLMEWSVFHNTLEQNTWTGSASEQQVLWHMLAYAYVPGMARRLAFWSLDGKERGVPFDAGMPGGEFWFLPNWDSQRNELSLPMPQVIDWLLDLLDAPSLQEINTGLGGRSLENEGGNDSVVRTLQNWRKGTTPQSAEIFEKLFPGDARLNFRGTYLLDKDLTVDGQFKGALALVQHKGLTANTLRDQIPIAVERLELILNGQASEVEKEEFVSLIALRYAKPTMKVIRQRLRIARMAQDGYERLMKALCGNMVEVTCTDPALNKLLQLLVLFQNVYNQTIAAWKCADSVEDQYEWFEAQFAPWDQTDLLLSIMPSQKETAYLTLAQRLTRKFMTLDKDSPLEDLVPLGDVTGGGMEVIKRRCLALAHEQEEDLRLMDLVDRAKRGSAPGRALQAETSFWVLSQFVHHIEVPKKLRTMGLQRMRELATTVGQTTQIILIELGFLLNGEFKQRSKNIQQDVQTLLDEATTNQGFEGAWKAPLLRLRAKHCLMKNDFKGANQNFDAALEACSERNFGGIKGEIARDGFATAIAKSGGANSQNHERYYRDLLRYDMVDGRGLSFEDAATQCEEFFWSDLYHPYPGFESKRPLSSEAFEAVVRETFGLIHNTDWEGLQQWFKTNAKKFRNMQFKDVRGDSVLMRWLKMHNDLQRKLPTLVARVPQEMRNEVEKIGHLIRNWRHAIELLITAWPEQAKISDFKGQTPLMLVADHGDEELTQLLAPISDVAAQDHIGRTAMHSAVSGRSPKCVALVLDLNPDMEKVTFAEKNTALHTAVRFGVPENVALITEAFPGLVLLPNVHEQTPIDMAQSIHADWPKFQTFMRNQNRSIGSILDFEVIIERLKTAAI